MTTEATILADGPKLAGRFYLPEGAKGVPGIVLAHGLLSRKEEFLGLPEWLVQAGYAVFAFDFQGHGDSDGLRSYHSEEQHEGDLRRAITALAQRPEVDPKRILVLGHSLGTVPVVKVLGNPPEGVVGGILLAPPSRVRQDTQPAEVFAYWLASQVARPLMKLTGQQIHIPYRVGPKDVYLDPEAQRLGAELKLIQPTLTLANYDYIMEQIDSAAAARAVKLPTLVVVGKEDKVVRNDNSREVFDAIACEDKEWVRLSPSGHSMMGDSAKDTLREVVLDWLKRHVA